MTMRRIKLTVVAGALVAVLAVTAIMATRRIQAGIETSVKHKSAKHTGGNVTGVTEIPSTSSPELNDRNKLFKVCFTIDNFDQIEDDMRKGYQSAELQRLSREGPRCKVTSKAALAKTLSKDDKVSVVYLLENQYQIDIVTISAHGKDL
jgi:hypothetical protein